MADGANEADFLEALIASERVEDWLQIIRSGTKQPRLTALKELAAAVSESESYAEEAQVAGAAGILTKLLAASSPADEDEESETQLIAKALTALCGHLAAIHQEHTFEYGGHSVVIKQGCLGEGLGARIWAVAHLMCRRLVEKPELVRGKHVLEIGSGCGLCGILAAKLGAAEVVLTDNEETVLLNLQTCMAANKVPSSSISISSKPADVPSCTSHDGASLAADVQASSICWSQGNMQICCLEWHNDWLRCQGRKNCCHGGKIGSDACTPPTLAVDEQFDFVLGTDVIYEEQHPELVAAVLAQRLNPGGQALLCCAALFDEFAQHVHAFNLLMTSQQIDPPHVKQGVFGQPHEYEGGFVLVTVTRRQ
ncbi:hypothetical protein WJX74_008328 [Apatococcus lobatus]|uniref:Uncharacterized protein n=1 Tax=Apatococcus lobatus TaxID=904363 RepID=A0AAW1S6K4_9CHLO